MEYKRDKLKNLFIINPMILKKEKRYIWISEDKEDIEGMACSLNNCIFHNIYFNGFVTNCLSIVGSTILNKQVYDVSRIIDEDLIILTENECNQFFCPVEILDPDVNCSDIVIWGAGKNGKTLAKYFHEKNVSISYFIDSDQNKIGKSIGQSVIYGIEEIENLSDKTSLIEASDNYIEMDIIMQRKAPHVECYRYIKSNKYFAPAILMYFKEVINSRDVYIYGYNDYAKQVRNCLEILDFNFVGFLVHEKQYNDADHDHEVWLLPEEILYCDNYYIIIVSDEKELAVSKLISLGLRYSADFSPIETISYYLLYARKNMIDINLGHTYQQKTGINGIDIYGKECLDNYKIAVLGGSTTDGTLFPFKSWPEIMFDQICNDKIVVYNAGVSGYTSAQELIKLIRDIIRLKPNMIIVYDGYNDTSETNACPGRYFEFTYLKQALDFAKKHMNRDWDFIAKDSGEEESKDVLPVVGNFENWLMNVEMMHAIAKDRGIKFYSFLQPMLSNKKLLTSAEEGIMFEIEKFQGLQQTVLMGKEFRRKIQDVVESHSYICDLSYLFDNYDDVYMDICHVRESANRIIATEILKRIEIPF